MTSQFEKPGWSNDAVVGLLIVFASLGALVGIQCCERGTKIGFQSGCVAGSAGRRVSLLIDGEQKCVTREQARELQK